MKRLAIVATAMLAACGVPSKFAPKDARIIDGDTFAYDGARYRLARIDAPELGECRRGRVCVEGDPVAAKHELAKLMAGAVTCERQGLDYYGRTLVECWAWRTNINDALVASGHAQAYRPPQ